MQIIAAAGKLCENEMIVKQWPMNMISKQHGPNETEIYFFKEMIKLELHVNPATNTEEAIETWRQRQLAMSFTPPKMILEGIVSGSEMYSQKKWPTTFNEMALVDIDILETSVPVQALQETLKTTAKSMMEANTDFGIQLKLHGGEVPLSILRAIWSEQRLHSRGDATPIVTRAQYCFPYIQVGARTPIYTPIYRYDGQAGARSHPFQSPPVADILNSQGIIVPETSTWYAWNDISKSFTGVEPSPRTVTSPISIKAGHAPDLTPNPYSGTVRKLYRKLSDTSPARTNMRRRTDNEGSHSTSSNSTSLPSTQQYDGDI